MAAAAAQAAEVRDAAGNVLVDGDSVTLIKDLKVKGANQTLKQGTVIRSIRLTDNPEEIDCRHDAIKGLVLRTEFVRSADRRNCGRALSARGSRYRFRLPNMPRTIARPSDVATDRAALFMAASTTLSRCLVVRPVFFLPDVVQIGRASCRERVCQYV